MNIVAKSDLNFHGYSFNTVSELGAIWLTSTDLAKALGYKKTDAVSQIYARNVDEFSDSMTITLNMRVVRKTGDIDMNVRVFSLRGAHLIAMFATTNKAKEFRRWVLDVLDREVASSPIAKQFTDDELCSLAWLWKASAVMMDACESVYPLLRVAEHTQAGRFFSIGQEYPRTLNKAKELLKRETSHIKLDSWRGDNWSRVLPNLRQDLLQ